MVRPSVAIKALKRILKVMGSKVTSQPSGECIGRGVSVNDHLVVECGMLRQ